MEVQKIYKKMLEIWILKNGGNSNEKLTTEMKIYLSSRKSMKSMEICL